MNDRASGLKRAEHDLTIRYEYDVRGRIVSAVGDVKLPQFVWVRTAEGTIWRFAADLPEDLVRAVARLAGRERGFVLAGAKPSAPPERLEMIRRRLEAGRANPSRAAETIFAEREWIWDDEPERAGEAGAAPRVRAEIWTLG